MHLATCVAVCLIGLAASHGYDNEEARKFASLASVSYCEVLDSVLSWTCAACIESDTRLVPGRIKIVDGGKNNATRIMIGKLADQDGCLMSFRGSDNLENWIRDLQFNDIRPEDFDDCDGCRVHGGFHSIWEAVRPLALDALREVGCALQGKDNLLYITGHSLGAALTHLAMFTLHSAGYHIAKTYSFEAPRVGNKAFSAAFSSRFSRKFPVFRITHSMDPVPHLPPRTLGYEHVPTEVWYDAAGNYTVCDGAEDTACADRYGHVANLILFHSRDHCGSSLLRNGSICNPAGCLHGLPARATIAI